MIQLNRHRLLLPAILAIALLSGLSQADAFVWQRLWLGGCCTPAWGISYDPCCDFGWYRSWGPVYRAGLFPRRVWLRSAYCCDFSGSWGQNGGDALSSGCCGAPAGATGITPPPTPPMPPSSPADAQPKLAPQPPAPPSPGADGTDSILRPGPVAPPKPGISPAPSGTSVPRKGQMQLTINVPADAEVSINGRPTRSLGPERRYVSYGLEPGKVYPYVVSVVVRSPSNGEDSRVTRTIYVRAGEERQVAFSQNLPWERRLAEASRGR